ncbi:hypothetical protein FRC10_005090, partial [Ceratobasidium sp. 414]
MSSSVTKTALGSIRSEDGNNLTGSFYIVDKHYYLTAQISPRTNPFETWTATIEYSSESRITGLHTYKGQIGVMTIVLSLDGAVRIVGKLKVHVSPTVPISGQDMWLLPNGQDSGNIPRTAETGGGSRLTLAPTPPREISSVVITSVMTVEEIISHLGSKGCIDMTGQLDLTSCSEYPISSGGMGDVYRCNLENGITVAIKAVRFHVNSSNENQKPLKLAARELYTWSKCRHRNVQPLLGLVKFRGQIGMLSTWEVNGSLHDYLESHPKVDRCRMVRLHSDVLSADISDGLSYLHESGVVHGDLKGPNVLVSEDGNPLLADFGNATLQEYTLEFSKSSTGMPISPRWAAPEILKGDTMCSFEADVYALGMETITGSVPYPEKGDRAVMVAVVIKKEFPKRPLEHIPQGSPAGDKLWSLLEKCWTYEPEQRPTAAQVVNVV